MKNILVLFLLTFFLFNSYSSQLTDFNYSLCYHTPDGLYYAAKAEELGLPLQSCKDINPPSQLEEILKRSFKCCEVLMTRKSGSGPLEIKGCMSIMSSYIDDDRYEDIIDYFERGKQYKLRNYFVMLGNSSFIRSMYYIAIVNGTKYDVQKLDCFSKNNWVNIFLILAILFLIY